MSSYSSLLQETETAKLVQLIVENAPIGIYTINKTGAIEFANPKFLEISGDSETELIGLNAFTLPTYKEYGLYPYLIQGLAGTPFEIEIRYVSYIGKKESFRHYVGVPLASPTGEIERLLLLVEDITARKRMEMKFQERIKELEQQIMQLHASFPHS